MSAWSDIEVIEPVEEITPTFGIFISPVIHLGPPWRDVTFMCARCQRFWDVSHHNTADDTVNDELREAAQRAHKHHEPLCTAKDTS